MSRPTLQYASLDQLELTREVASHDWLAGSTGKCYLKGNAESGLNPAKMCMVALDGEVVCGDTSKVAFMDGASHILGVPATKVCPTVKK
jgi:hypothetical protein